MHNHGVVMGLDKMQTLDAEPNTDRRTHVCSEKEGETVPKVITARLVEDEVVEGFG